MLARISGTLESLHETTALIALPSGAAYHVLLPAYLADRLSGRRAATPAIGGSIHLHTLQYFESLNQGASFIPRLIGFESPVERDFFELLTTVKGLGNKRALRAMTLEPASIARSIHDRDTRALQRLPEIGPKLAELIVHELKGKVELFARASSLAAPAALNPVDPPAIEAKPARKPRIRLGDSPQPPQPAPEPEVVPPPPPIRQAVETLIALGEAPPEAERMVARALDLARAARHPLPATPQALLHAAYAAR